MLKPDDSPEPVKGTEVLAQYHEKPMRTVERAPSRDTVEERRFSAA
jgi:hypothetical protein